MPLPVTTVVGGLGPRSHDPTPHLLPVSPLLFLENFARFLMAGSFLTTAWLGSQLGATFPVKGNLKAHFTDEETEIPRDYLRPVQLVYDKVGTARPIFKLQDTCSPLHPPCPPRCQVSSFQPRQRPLTHVGTIPALPGVAELC